MTYEQSEIFVFKTNINHRTHIDLLAPSLDGHPGVKQWNVDAHDKDCVLRIVPTTGLRPNEIISLVKEIGFSCEELPD